MITQTEIRRARALAVEEYRGRKLTAEEKLLVSRAINEMSPENFYMDGELFAYDDWKTRSTR